MRRTLVAFLALCMVLSTFITVVLIMPSSSAITQYSEQVINYYPTADAGVRNTPTYNNTNFGTLAELDISETNKWNSYMRWNITAPNQDAWVIGAELWLYHLGCAGSGWGHGVKPYQVTEVWGENYITWNNAPDLDTGNQIGVGISFDATHISGPTWISWADTYILNNAHSQWENSEVAGTGKIGFGFNWSTLNVNQNYYSKEQTGTVYDPYLSITWRWEAPPLVTWTTYCDATADSWVDALWPSSNYGYGDTMQIQDTVAGGHLNRLYIRWNLTDGGYTDGVGVPDGAWILSAKLYLYKNHEFWAETPRTVSIWQPDYGTGTNWAEMAITYGNQPWTNPLELLQPVEATDVGWQTYDAAPLSAAIEADFNATNGFHMAMTMHSTDAAINSYFTKEYTTGAYAPYLEVTWWHPDYAGTEQPEIPAGPIWSAGFMSGVVVTAFWVVGFFGMIASVGLTAMWWREGDERLRAVITGLFMWMLFFGLWWAGLHW